MPLLLDKKAQIKFNTIAFYDHISVKYTYIYCSLLTKQTAGFRAWTTKEENSFSSESW